MCGFFQGELVQNVATIAVIILVNKSILQCNFVISARPKSWKSKSEVVAVIYDDLALTYGGVSC